MSILSRCKSLGRVRTHLVAFALGLLVSTLSADAFAGSCLHSSGPYYVGVPVHVLFGTCDDNPGAEPYTISWGDGTATTGSVHGFKFYRTSPCPIHRVFGTHTYSTAVSGISIVGELDDAIAVLRRPSTFSPPPPPPPPPPSQPPPSPPATLLPPPTFNVQGLWWNAPAGSESGWGISLAHQGDTVFAFWFTYDVAGRSWWLVMTARRSDTNTYTGVLYQTQGPSFAAVPFNPAMVTSSAVGTGTLAFSDARNGTFTYNVDGVNQTKAITRQVFGTPPTCIPSALSNLALATNFQDLWWAAPARSESGWSISLSHQGDNIFATWATYDVDGLPLWLSALAQRQGLSNIYNGTIYRTAGPRFDAFDAAALGMNSVGTATFTFLDGNLGTFAYTTTGGGALPAVTQTKWITRFLFGDTGGTVCQ